MVDCPMSFSSLLQLPPKPLIIDFEVTVPVPGALAGRIVFDQDMDTGVVPSVGTFLLTQDGTPFPMTPVGWTGTDRLDCNTTASPPTTTGFVRQLILDTNCRSALGTFAKPQSNIQWFP